jgi:hypothetical protein
VNHVLKAARLQLVHPLAILGIPWAVAISSFVINLAIWAVAGLGGTPSAFTGGLVSLHVTFLLVHVQSITRLLPFAMSVSITRRNYYLGMTVVAVAESIAYGIALSILAAVERASGGWGVGLGFWAPGSLADLNRALPVLAYAGPLLACACLGMEIGVVQKRWGGTGLWTLAIGSLVVVGGLVVLLTWARAWESIGGWVTNQAPLTLTAGLPLLLAVALAGLTWTALRRVVP